MPLPLKLASGELREFASGDAVPATSGGTGITSFAVGDIFYANSTTTLAKLPAGILKQVLRSNGTGVAPSWGAIDLGTAVAASGILTAGRGGTGVATITGLVKGNGTDPFSAAQAGTDYVEPAAVREKLSAARTYYVRGDGSDSNTGLANTSAGAFLTIQKAIDVAAALDNGGYAITIQVGDGTYTGANTLKAYVGSGSMTVLGNATTPANVVISTTNANCFIGTDAGSWVLNGLKVQTATSGRGVFVLGATKVTLTNLNFGACVYEHILAAQGAIVNMAGSWTISGSCPTHISLTSGSKFNASSIACTLTGTPAFTYFVQVDQVSLAVIASITFSGTATGGRYQATLNSVIQTYGGGASYLPGSVAGSTATGGQYA